MPVTQGGGFLEASLVGSIDSRFVKAPGNVNDNPPTWFATGGGSADHGSHTGAAPHLLRSSLRSIDSPQAQGWTADPEGRSR